MKSIFRPFRLLLALGLFGAGVSLTRAQSPGSVTIQFSAGALYDSTGSAVVPDGSLVLLLADTSGVGFSQLQAGNINIADYLDGGLQVIARATIDSGFYGAGKTIGSTGDGINDSIPLLDEPYPHLDSNQQLAIAWFPSATSSTFSLTSGASYGLVTDPSWIVPTPGGTVTYEFVSNDNSARASQLISAIPEPADSAVFLAAAALLWTFRRRHRG